MVAQTRSRSRTIKDRSQAVLPVAQSHLSPVENSPPSESTAKASVDLQSLVPATLSTCSVLTSESVLSDLIRNRPVQGPPTTPTRSLSKAASSKNVSESTPKSEAAVEEDLPNPQFKKHRLYAADILRDQHRILEGVEGVESSTEALVSWAWPSIPSETGGTGIPTRPNQFRQALRQGALDGTGFRAPYCFGGALMKLINIKNTSKVELRNTWAFVCTCDQKCRYWILLDIILAEHERYMKFGVYTNFGDRIQIDLLPSVLSTIPSPTRSMTEGAAVHPVAHSMNQDSEIGGVLLKAPSSPKVEDLKLDEAPSASSSNTDVGPLLFPGLPDTVDSVSSAAAFIRLRGFPFQPVTPASSAPSVSHAAPATVIRTPVNEIIEIFSSDEDQPPSFPVQTKPIRRTQVISISSDEDEVESPVKRLTKRARSRSSSQPVRASTEDLDNDLVTLPANKKFRPRRMKKLNKGKGRACTPSVDQDIAMFHLQAPSPQGFTQSQWLDLHAHFDRCPICNNWVHGGVEHICLGNRQREDSL